MDVLQRIRDTIPRAKDSGARLTSLDQLTKSVAVAASRRTFLKRILAGGAAVGLGLWEVLPARAECNGANTCTGSCGCFSDITCCDGRGHCYYKACDLGGGCVTPPGVYAWITTYSNCAPFHRCFGCIF